MSSIPPYSSLAIQVTTLSVAITGALFGLYALLSGNFHVFELLVPVLLTIAIFGMHFAAKAIPWWQLVSAGAVIWLIHFGSELVHIAPIAILGEKIVEIVCVFGFGTYWVRKGYLPKNRNRW